MTDFELVDLDVTPDPERHRDRDRIQVGEEPETIRALTEHINRGTSLPDLYVTDGALTLVARVSGDTDSSLDAIDDAGTPLPVKATELTAASLARLLAEHTETFKLVTKRDGTIVEVEHTPTRRALEAVLSQDYWPGVRPLRGVVGAPVLRPDGSLLQARGYDQRTGLYYAPKVPLPPIPDKPDQGDVEAARGFLLDQFLHDFPWVTEADRANFIGLLMTQILRPMVRALSPLGLITATTQASGKTILSDAIGQLFGQKLQPWVRSDTELRKNITAILATTVGTVLFDNLKEGLVIDSPVLATLLTAPVWSDRLLGANKTFTAVNDKLWLVTGNNLRLGGDMATRTVAVRLDPKVPRPEARTGFTIPNLDQWLREPANQRTLLRNLLVLALDWVNAGAPRADHTMRQFTAWAQGAGGFLDHHGIKGFLANSEDVREMDDEDAEWAAFLGRWHSIFGSEKKTTAVIRQSADFDPQYPGGPDRWGGDFITDDDGHMPNAKSLGRRLAGQVGRFHGRYVLRGEQDPHRKQKVWCVEEYQS